MPPAVDYDMVYLPALHVLFSGANPFDVFGFYNPPWILSLLLPFGLLPYTLGRILFLVVSLGCLLFTAHQLGASKLGMGAIALSPLAFNSLAWGNVEGLTLLGLVLPLPIGLVLLAIKPQETWCVMVFLLWRLYRQRGGKSILITLLPLLGLFMLSWALYGFYPMHWLNYSGEAGINFSFYPYTLPLGIILVWQAFKTHKLGYALAASPLFFQTLSPQVWLVEFLAIASLTAEVTLASLATWGTIMLIRVRST